MNESEELYFELIDGANLVRLEPLLSLNDKAALDWDKNWIKTLVTIKGGKFSGNYSGDFMTFYFENFKQELLNLYHNLNGAATFNDLEGYLELKIIGDGLGHFEVNVSACDEPGINASELSFSMNIDQTEITKLVNQLNQITKHFPIIGDL